MIASKGMGGRVTWNDGFLKTNVALIS